MNSMHTRVYQTISNNLFLNNKKKATYIEYTLSSAPEFNISIMIIYCKANSNAFHFKGLLEKIYFYLSKHLVFDFISDSSLYFKNFHMTKM